MEKFEHDSGTDKMRALPGFSSVALAYDSTPSPQLVKEFDRSCRGQESLSGALQPQQPGQRADADQIIVHHLLRHRDDENEVHEVFLSVKDDPFPAPADPEENSIDEFGAGMREGDAAIGYCRGLFLARHHRLEKFARLVQLADFAEQFYDLPNRFAGRAPTQVESDVFRIEQTIEEWRDHWAVQLID